MTPDDALDLTRTANLIPLLQRHGFSTRKSLGQHFLISRHVLEAIVAACELQEGLPVLEIGPGIGTLTRALAEQGARVTAVELDARAVAVLGETVGAFPTVRVLQQDILALDLPALLGEECWTVVGNLPYYITTPVIGKMLETASRFRRMVFMVQREVADRLGAAPGTKDYGSLSVFAQVYATVERVAKVPRGAFLPPPTVESAVVRLTVRPAPLVPPALQDTFFRVVRAAFGQRRKMLENALAGGGILDGERPRIADALATAGIAPGRRGETLGIEEFRRLAEAIGIRDE
ncbi:MAG: 16S rRNA (adenine(1518)-N(6)/adenine(1519)-N(6))-dimethyltransferase RsmA [Armatimonadota bacterium]